MIELVFDTETTGFPHNGENLTTQPYMIQLAAICFKDKETIQDINSIIQIPIEVPENSFRIHGISMEKSQKDGRPLKNVMSTFGSLLTTSDRLIAFNMQFDLRILKISYQRSGFYAGFSDQIEKICVMKSAAKFLRIPGGRITLKKAYEHFINPVGFSNAHDAMADTEACMKVYLALKERGAELFA